MLSVNCKDCLLFTIGIKDTFAVHEKDILLESAILHQGSAVILTLGTANLCLIIQ